LKLVSKYGDDLIGWEARVEGKNSVNFRGNLTVVRSVETSICIPSVVVSTCSNSFNIGVVESIEATLFSK